MKKLAVIIIMILCAMPSLAQDKKDHEVSSEVKELFNFHDVIYQVWHTGWPNKDITFLSSLMPQIEDGFISIKKAELPGILRDKKVKWNEGLVKFEKCVSEYKTAVDKKDSVGIMNAAENLHTQYELLVRVIRPMIKEMDPFHQVLYMLYHYYVPKNEMENIQKSTPELKAKMEILNKAVLSAKQKPREESFNKARTELSAFVEKFVKAVETKNQKNISEAMDNMHTKYQSLEKVFE